MEWPIKIPVVLAKRIARRYQSPVNSGTGRLLCLMHRLDHACGGVSSKLFLRATYRWITNASQYVIRFGKCQHVVPDGVVCVIPFHQKSFFTAHYVAGKGAIGETKSCTGFRFVYDVNDPARIEPPKSNCPTEDADHLTRPERLLGRPRINPTQFELFPIVDGGFGGLKNGFTFAQLDPIVINRESRRQGSRGSAYGRVRESPLRFIHQKLANSFERRLLNRQQTRPRFSIRQRPTNSAIS